MYTINITHYIMGELSLWQYFDISNRGEVHTRQMSCIILFLKAPENVILNYFR